MAKQKKSRAKQVILSIAIALVLVFFVAYSISVFYESPDYEDFCGEGEIRVPKLVGESINESACLDKEGKWTARDYPCVVGDICLSGFCDQDFTCRQEYQDSRDVYNRDVFVVSLILGLVILVTGILLKLESVSVGIMGGGALLIVYGTMRYWGELGKYFRLVILGAVLAALIYLGYKKFGDK